MKSFIVSFSFILLACSSPKLPRSKISYKIINETGLREDNAPCYVVLIPAVTFPGPGFRDSIETLVDEFAAKVGDRKFELEIYDDSIAVNIYVESIVKQQRLYSKKEDKILNQHWVGYYSGELMNGGMPTFEYKHELSLYPDIMQIEKTGSKVKISNSKEYVPTIN